MSEGVLASGYGFSDFVGEWLQALTPLVLAGIGVFIGSAFAVLGYWASGKTTGIWSRALFRAGLVIAVLGWLWFAVICIGLPG
jgi:hypothetical protein